jgi:hypothetical protein
MDNTGCVARGEQKLLTTDEHRWTQTNSSPDTQRDRAETLHADRHRPFAVGQAFLPAGYGTFLSRQSPVGRCCRNAHFNSGYLDKCYMVRWTIFTNYRKKTLNRSQPGEQSDLTRGWMREGALLDAGMLPPSSGFGATRDAGWQQPHFVIFPFHDPFMATNRVTCASMPPDAHTGRFGTNSKNR